MREPPVLRVETDQIGEVIGFYRGSALAIGAVAADLQAHDFGRWARPAAADAESGGAETGELDTLELDGFASDHARMARALTNRLHAHVAAAERLADALQHGTQRVADTDSDAAEAIRAAAPARGIAADGAGRP